MARNDAVEPLVELMGTWAGDTPGQFHVRFRVISQPFTFEQVIVVESTVQDVERDARALIHHTFADLAQATSSWAGI